jgi:hypothetical protein
VDPSRGWALIGHDMSIEPPTAPAMLVSRMLITKLTPTGDGVWLPAEQIGMADAMGLHRLTIKMTDPAVNDPQVSDDTFKMDWPADLKTLVDDKTGKKIERKATTTTEESGGL